MCRRNHESFPSEYVSEEEEHAIRERTSGIFQLTFQRNTVWLCCNWFVELPLVRKNKIKIKGHQLEILNILKYILLEENY